MHTVYFYDNCTTDLRRNVLQRLVTLAIIVSMSAGNSTGKYDRAVKRDSDDSDQDNPNGFKSWSESGLWNRWTFSLATPLIKLGLTRIIEHSDLIPIDDREKSDHIVELLKKSYEKTRSALIFPRLLLSLFRVYMFETVLSAVYSLLEGATRIAAPVILG